MPFQADYQDGQRPEAGSLVSYGPSPRVVWRDGGHVSRIVAGGKPVDLPVQESTNFELVMDRKTAKALGLTIPPSILASADEVIE